MIQSADNGPLARSLLAGGVKYLFHYGFSVGVLESQYLTGNLYQVGVKLPPVPLIKDVSHLVIGKGAGVEHQVPCFAYQLHVAVLDAVVGHLDEVPGAVVAYPGDAGGTVRSPGSDGMENILHMGPRFPGSAGHERRTQQGTLFAAGDTGADVKQPLALNIFCPSDGVGEVGVAPLNDDISLVEQRDDHLN